MFAKDMMICAEVPLPQSMEPDGQTPQDPIQQLMNQVAIALGQTDVYRRTLDSLQQLTAEGGIDCQILLKAVSLEAIRLTVATLVSDPTAVIGSEPMAADRPELSPVKLAEPELTEPELAEPVAEANTTDPDSTLFASLATVMQPAPRPNPLKSMLAKYHAQRQAAAVEELILTREAILLQIGERVLAEREAKKMSIAQLHARTFIPMYHLQALEGGHIEQLPEDIYLRGFLRRIENALGLEIGCLVEAMPSLEPVAIVPSWSQQSAKTKRKNFGGLDINPTHLYFTYAAIMAGGVCWLSNQTAPKTNLPELNYEPRAQNPMLKSTPNFNWANQPKAKAKLATSNTTPKPTNKPTAASMGSASLKIGVAPPETMP
jgi:cytoskeleton protein RodZ